MELENVNKLPKIPLLRTPAWKDVDIAGRQVRVHKPHAMQAAIVATRFAETFGVTLLTVLSSPEKFKGPDGEDTTLMELIGSEAGSMVIFKRLIAIGVLPTIVTQLKKAGIELGHDHVWWYAQQMLPGCVELDGWRFKTMDELNDSGFTALECLDLLWNSFELAIYPTAGDQSTTTGSPQEKASTPKEPRESSLQSPAQSNGLGASDMAGQSVRTFAGAG